MTLWRLSNIDACLLNILLILILIIQYFKIFEHLANFLLYYIKNIEI